MATYTTIKSGERKGQVERVSAKEKAAAALERLDTGCAEILASDGEFAEYLRMAGAMHGYSWGNRMLIYLQRPDTRMVAGYGRWRDLGRQVKKGAKGIPILAPCVVKRDAGMENAGLSTPDGPVDDQGKVSKVVGFRCVYVFAVEDTEGPAYNRPAPAEISDDSELVRDKAAGILGMILAAGVPVTYGATGSAEGWYSVAEKSITLTDRDRPAAMRCKTLLHEYAHHLAGVKAGDDRASHEVIAEGAAMVAAAYWGLDTDTYSIPYVAAWAGDAKRVSQLLGEIVRIADIMSSAETCPACHGEGCYQCR